MRRTVRLSQVSVLAAWLAVGCSNHVRYVEFEERNHRVDVKGLRYEIEDPPDIVETPKLELAYLREERVATHVDVTLNKVEEFVPYRATRELYEVPLGLVSIPLSLALNVVGAVLPAVVSAELVDRYTAWTFAAANPVLNNESAGRVERRQLSGETRTADVKENIVQNPLVDWPVEARFDDDRPVVLRTDAEGKLSFHVLELRAQSLQAPPRKLTLSVGSEKSATEPLTLELYVDRQLAQRVYEAGQILPVLGEAVVSSTQLSHAVYALDRIGFKEYSLRLEDEIYKRFESNEAFLDRFREVLRKLYAGELEYAPPWHVVVPPDEKPTTGPPLEN